MQSGTRFEGGEVVLVPVPFTDLSQTKRRPVLVVSNLKHNMATRDFISCGITSNLGNRPYSVLLDPSDMMEGVLPVRSRIKYDKIFTLEKNLVIKRIGKISSEKLRQVRESLISLLS